MMKLEEFREHGHQLVDWMADYFGKIESFPVKSQSKPGDILKQLPEKPPAQPESFDAIMEDFNSIIMPGVTHWQSPNFFAYFNANSSYPSVLAEMLTASLGAQCMIWETSPAAAELEERVLTWLRDVMELPSHFEGVIQDTASAATLCAILSAREKATGFESNQNGLSHNKFRVYCSDQTHSSIDKSVKIAGLGNTCLVKIATDEKGSLKPEELKKALQKDIAAELIPICVIATLGTTSTTAIDSIQEIGPICSEFDVWLHVDAAFGGTALMLPEYHWIAKGAEHVDSFVFNPHKWMFTNFDCSVYFVKDAQQLIRTFEILPEYLKTRTRGQVNDYRDWGVALGRRFRALKLWFVIRSFGIEGIRKRLREHLSYTRFMIEQLEAHPQFEILAPVPFNLICFRYVPDPKASKEEINEINEHLMQQLNQTGRAYFTHTKIQGNYAIRMVIGQTYLTLDHVQKAWQLILETTESK